MVEIIRPGSHASCGCNQNMLLVTPKTEYTSMADDKHLPVVAVRGREFTVSVGVAPHHPMDANHYIEWIEVQTEACLCRHYLRPGQAPLAVFYLETGKVVARACCNQHGVWASPKIVLRE